MCGCCVPGRGELAHGGEDAVFEQFEVGNRGAVGAQAELEVAGLGDGRDPERVLGRERDDRHDVEQRCTERE